MYGTVSGSTIGASDESPNGASFLTVAPGVRCVSDRPGRALGVRSRGGLGDCEAGSARCEPDDEELVCALPIVGSNWGATAEADADPLEADAAARAAAQLPRAGESLPPGGERPPRARNEATGSPLSGSEDIAGGINSTSSKLNSSSSPLARHLRGRADLFGTVAGLGLRARLALALGTPPGLPRGASARARVRPEVRVVPAVALRAAIFEEPDESSELDVEQPEPELERSEWGSDADADEHLESEPEHLESFLLAAVCLERAAPAPALRERAPPLVDARDFPEAVAASASSASASCAACDAPPSATSAIGATEQQHLMRKLTIVEINPREEGTRTRCLEFLRKLLNAPLLRIEHSKELKQIHYSKFIIDYDNQLIILVYVTTN